MVALCLFAGCAVAFLGVAHYLRPYVERSQRIDLSLLGNYDLSTVFYDRHGVEIGRTFIENRLLLDEGKPLPVNVKNALIAAEDRRFSHHRGLDWRGLLRAALVDLKHRRIVQGGSTLTQQLAKHLINDSSRNLDRKIYEILVALRIERHYSKEQILRYYMNRVYFGSGYLGVEAAAEGYFGRHARDLTVGQAALLGCLVSSPNRTSPRLHPERTVPCRNRVIHAMEELKMISPEEAAAARSERLVLVPRPRK